MKTTEVLVLCMQVACHISLEEVHANIKIKLSFEKLNKNKNNNNLQPTINLIRNCVLDLV
jgi:hypothetical protein